jgi:hypothetical protein
VEHGARRQRHLVVASRAFPTMPRAQRVSMPMPATRTSKPIRPPTRLQIFLARRFVGKLALKLGQTARERGPWHGPHYS